MEIASILAVLAILVLVGAYVSRPLYEPALTRGGRGNPALSRLQARRERLLDAIRELDADHRLGKVPADEYREHRRILTKQGAAVLRRIDEVTRSPAVAGLEAELEARVAELKGSRQARGGPDEAGALPDGARSREARAEPDASAAVRQAVVADQTDEQAQEGRPCPACGAQAVAGDRFCSNCGTALRESGA